MEYEEGLALVKKFLLWAIVVIVALAVAGGAAAYLGVFNPAEDFDNYMPVVKNEPEQRTQALETYQKEHPELQPKLEATAEAQYEADRKRAAEADAKVKAAQSERGGSTQTPEERQAAMEEYLKNLK